MISPGHLPKKSEKASRWWKPFLGSFTFHACLTGAILSAAIFYRTHPLPASGSPEATLSLSLSRGPATTAVSAPLPAPAKPTPAPVRPTTIAVTPTPKPVNKLVDEGVPVLAPQVKAAPTTARPTPQHTVSTHSTRPPKIAAAASAAHAAPIASSYAAGENAFPHPPYPDEARERREIGTVKLNVRFDTRGDVAEVEVVQSSGSLILDHETKTFIRSNWHSMPEAGQTVSVPVCYSLENM